MYKWYWFRKLQLGETDPGEPSTTPRGPVPESVRVASPSRVRAESEARPEGAGVEEAA